MGPLAVDPQALYAAGSAVAAAGGGLAANMTVLAAGFAAHTGLDAAGTLFGLEYQSAGESLLTAATAVINACGQSGAKIQQGAVNYSNADAASNLRGGAGVLQAPPAPTEIAPPGPPGTWGKGEPPPLLWAVVQSFLDDVWPDGDVGALHAAAGRWRSFGAAIGGVGGSLNAAKTLLDGQHIPEGDKIDQALSLIGGCAARVGKGCEELARRLDEFASEVAHAQQSIRDLLNRLGSLTDLGHDLMLIVKGDALEEIKKVVNDIQGVLHNLGREARAAEQEIKMGMQIVDGEVVKLEKYVRGELKQYLGDPVGNQMATVFDMWLNANEGVLKGAVGMAQAFGDLDPRWFLLDPEGASDTWANLGKGLWKGSLFNAFLNPQEASEAHLQQLKGLLHLEDWSRARPALGFGENLFDLSTFLIPGGGEVGAAADGAGAAARGAKAAAEAGEAEAAGGRVAGGIAGVVGPRGALADIAATGSKLTKDLEGLTANLPKIEPPPVGGRPVGLPPGKLPDAPVGPAPHAPDAAPGAPHGPGSREPPGPTGGQPAPAPGGGPHEPGGGPPASAPAPAGGPHEPPAGATPAAPAPAPPGGPHEPGFDTPAASGPASGGSHGSVPTSHSPEPASPSGGGSHGPGFDPESAPAQAGATEGGPHGPAPEGPAPASPPGSRWHEPGPEPAPAQAGATAGGPHGPDSLPTGRPHEPVSEPAGGPREPVSVTASGPHEPASVPGGGPHEPAPTAPPVSAPAAVPAAVGDRLPSAVPTAAESAPARAPLAPGGASVEPAASAATPHSMSQGGRPTELLPPGHGGGHGTGDGSPGGPPGRKSPPGGGPHGSGGGGPRGTGGSDGGPPGGGGPRGSGDGGTSGGHGDGGDGSAGDGHGGSSDGARQDPVHSGEPSGDGWRRLESQPLDPHYGEPLPEHWDFPDNPVDPSQVKPSVADLIKDPDAPFGRDPQGNPYTEKQYAERFNKVGDEGQTWYNFPGNDGAVPGTRVAYTEAEKFVRDYGSQLDRIGKDGKYLAVMENGQPASWEQRALHVDSLRDPYNAYELGALPEGWTIEVSEVAPGVGQPGGSIQVRIFDEEGVARRVDELLRRGVLRK